MHNRGHEQGEPLQGLDAGGDDLPFPPPRPRSFAAKNKSHPAKRCGVQGSGETGVFQTQQELVGEGARRDRAVETKGGGRRGT